MAVKRIGSSSRRTVTRILGHLGKVIKLLHQLKAMFPQSESFFDKVELELIYDALDITELCSGLPDREDRLSCIRDAGISVPDDYDELYDEVW